MREIILDRILGFLLKGTWHICKHQWETKFVDVKGKYTEQYCIKCKVCSTTQYGNYRMILVNPETNNPFYFIFCNNLEKTKGIHLE